MPRAGTAATAAPVSCVAGATTGTGDAPVSVATAVRSGPSTVPGGMMLPRMCAGSPNACTSGKAQPFAVGSYSCVVLTRQGAGAAPHFVRSCIEGPVFDARRIVWEALAH